MVTAQIVLERVAHEVGERPSLGFSGSASPLQELRREPQSEPFIHAITIPTTVRDVKQSG